MTGQHEDDQEANVMLHNTATGHNLLIPRYLTRVERVSELRSRIRRYDPIGSACVRAPQDITIDVEKKTYKFASYPPLGFLVNLRWFVVFGAFLIAATSRIQFYFPCLQGSSALTWQVSSYCVRNEDMHRVTSTVCPADVCVKRIPVSLQTYAVLLNGAIAGRTGALATFLYVLMVCLGAPFGSDGLSVPVWEKGAIVGPTGGFFIGFIFASLIMGICAEKGHDRARSAHWLVLYMLGAEAAIYACGLFWLPFGLAIRRGVNVTDVCPDFGTSAGASKCLSTITSIGLTPFIPGELVKMLLVLGTVPLAWYLLLLFYSRFQRTTNVTLWEESSSSFTDIAGNTNGAEATGTDTALASRTQDDASHSTA